MIKLENLKTLGAWATLLILLATYWLTVAPTVSYWDCPEYVAAAYLLEVGHPPGNPLWMLVCRMATLFVPGQYAALAVNLSSGLFSALAGMLLYLSVFEISALLLRGGSRRVMVSRFLAAISAALIFGWCDSTWYSAVEAEVYALSILITALTLWLMVRWAMTPLRGPAWRLLLLVAYIFGLSTGAHQLNLLAIPALALIWCFKRRRTREVSRWQILFIVLASFVVTGALLFSLPASIKLCALCELVAVNRLNLPFLSGLWIFFGGSALLGLVVVILLRRYGTARLRILFAMGLLFCVGMSVYMIIPIRGHIPSPANAGMPCDPFSFAAYQAREQYGGSPLLYGQTPYSQTMKIEKTMPDGSVQYRYTAVDSGNRLRARVNIDGHDRYLVTGCRLTPRLTPELNIWFPRITSRDPQDLQFYANWAGMTEETMDRVPISEAYDSLGRAVSRQLPDGSRPQKFSYRPTQLQNIQYLITYQIGYMYLRYLLWNFSGRQNDIPSTGEPEHGNFITGFNFIDRAMLGAENLPPARDRHNAGRNRYFMLPLLLGIVGMVWLARRSRLARRVFLVNLALFLMTGLAIVVYLNQTPGEPRERDYSFLGSYLAYAAFCGFGILGILASQRLWRSILGAALAVGIPLLMLHQNIDDHDRSGRLVASRLAQNMLNSLEPNAIIFVDGDNYTFPLWYAQEVEGVRRDVRVVNLSYLTLPQYARMLTRDWRDSRRLQIPSLSPDDHQPSGNFRRRTMLDIVHSNPERPIYWQRSLPTSQLCGLAAETRPALLARRYGLAPDSVIMNEMRRAVGRLQSPYDLSAPIPYIDRTPAAQIASQRAALTIAANWLDSIANKANSKKSLGKTNNRIKPNSVLSLGNNSVRIAADSLLGKHPLSFMPVRDSDSTLFLKPKPTK